MKRKYNLSAGPAILPNSVLETAQREMFDYNNTGMSVMELSHRSDYFEEILKNAEQNLRELLNIKDNYKVLFLQGGASQVFTTLVMNLRKTGKVAYVDSGYFANKAIEAAEELTDQYELQVDVISSSKADSYKKLPELPDTLKGYDYLHICSNNTIEGTEFKELPKYDVPLVVDMSSNILSRPINIEDYGMIYAGAQKNLGIAGLTLVIIREDLIGINDDIPTIFDYKVLSDKNSMYNTPSTYPIYIHKLVTDWIIDIGGSEEVFKRNKKKANLLYNSIDESKLFKGNVEKDARSLMNVTFTTGNDDLDKKFITFLKDNHFENVKGHRSTGGMRASIYNAFPIDGIEEFVKLIKQFEEENL